MGILHLDFRCSRKMEHGIRMPCPCSSLDAWKPKKLFAFRPDLIHLIHLIHLVNRLFGYMQAHLYVRTHPTRTWWWQRHFFITVHMSPD
jgi:hypothetical protein